MADLHIQEYVELGRVSGGSVPVGMEPPVAIQKTTYTITSVQSGAINAKTNFVRVIATGDSKIAFGVDPTATANSMLIKAGVAEYFGVPVGSGYKIAAIDA